MVEERFFATLSQHGVLIERAEDPLQFQVGCRNESAHGPHMAPSIFEHDEEDCRVRVFNHLTNSSKHVGRSTAFYQELADSCKVDFWEEPAPKRRREAWGHYTCR